MAQNTELTSFLLKPTVTETSGILDLSLIVDKLETYSKDTCIRTEAFILGDLTFKIGCYPNENKSVSLYLKITPRAPPENDLRNVYFSLQSGGQKLHWVQSLCAVKRLWGWRQAFTHSQIQQYPTIQYTIKLTHNPTFIQRIPSRTLIQQHERMHQLSIAYGDITLIIKLPELAPDNVNVSDILQPPPIKRIRVNEEYKCTVCNKQFASNKALKSHQSNKRDEAHKKYKNNHHNNHNNVDSLECNEIKISSVILRSASEVFDRMLDTNMMEKEQKTIEIHAQSVDDVKDMVYYMSTNTLRSGSDPFALIELANLYSMDRLFWECVNRIISGINMQNFAQSVNTFTKYEISDGYKNLVEFAKKNVEELKAMPDFENIPFIFKCLVFDK